MEIQTLYKDLPIAEAITKILDDNKAEEITAFDLTNNPKINIADYVIIATGRSDPHLIALADKLVSWVKHNTNYPYHTEGKQQRSGWVLVDLGVVIVQLFITEKRKLYNLEALYC